MIGGAGNVDRPSLEELERNWWLNQQLEEEARRKEAHEKEIKGLADKGKEFLFRRRQKT